MTLTIEVAPETESALESEATRRGVSREQLASEMLSVALGDALQDLEDAAEARRILANSDPAKRRTLAELKQAIGQ